MANYPGVIIAGGRAERMGGEDKGLLPLAGQTVLDHVLDRLAPQCSKLALNANGDPDRFRRFGLPVLPDEVADRPGPLAGVLAAMVWAAGQGAEHVVTVAADTPFFPRDLVARLSASEGFALAASQPLARDESPQLHPVFGVWPVSLAGALRESLSNGERKVRMWAKQNGAIEVVFSYPSVDPFFNINTPEDARQAKALARGDQCFRMK